VEFFLAEYFHTDSINDDGYTGIITTVAKRKKSI